jgi:hypothetical protein
MGRAVSYLNDVHDNVGQTGSGIPGGGIVLMSGDMFGAGPPTATPSGRTGSRAIAEDIDGDGSGTGNTVGGNTCTTTNLTGAC